LSAGCSSAIPRLGPCSDRPAGIDERRVRDRTFWKRGSPCIWIPKANNGELLVFPADGTFLWAETQEFFGLPSTPVHYGQERGCYSVAASSVTFDDRRNELSADGFTPYDLNNSSFNGLGGRLRAGVATTLPIPFTIEDDETLIFNGSTFKRTHPN
jgi:hypothetical protein